MDVNKVIEELKEAARVYYQGDGEIMTDREYDLKCDYLRELVDKGELEMTKELSELLYESVSAGTVPDGEVIEHAYPMLSLDKANDTDGLEMYHKRLVNAGATGFKLEGKFDGLALSCDYPNGVLEVLATRGDGEKGESLSYLLKNDKIEIKGLPKKLSLECELRGELYMTDEQFERASKAREIATGKKFSNSRNAVVGIVKKAKKGIDYKAELTFTAYSAHVKGAQIAFDELGEEIENASRVTDLAIERLVDKGHTKGDTVIESKEFSDLMEAVEAFGVLREGFDIPTDGVVIKPLNEIDMGKKLGYTSKHPVSNIAYKYAGEAGVTRVEEIIVSVGKSGKLTPQVKLQPVEVGGVVISRASCHNYSWLITKGIREGSLVSVTRANDVIPAVEAVIEVGDGEEIAVPSNCPKCGELLKGDGSELPKTLICENLACPSRFLYHLRSAVGRDYLYLEGLGNVALESLVENRVVSNIVDVFKLTEECLAGVPTGVTSKGNEKFLGKGNAKNIMKSIERAKKSTESHKLIASLNIDGMGPNTAKRLIKHFGGAREVLEVEPTRLLEVDQVGQSLVESFEAHQSRASREFEELIELGFVVNDIVEKTVDTMGTFSVSGSVEGFSNRDEFVEHMQSLGWEYHKSPKKTTDILFADPESTSSKIIKARANGTRILRGTDEI